MLFNSLAFLVFFAVVYPTYRVLGLRGQNRLLLAAGYLFYGWWDVRFLFLLTLSTGIDFCCGLMLGTGRVPARDRRLVSAYVLAAAFGFVTVQWEAVRLVSPASTGAAGMAVPAIAVDWRRTGSAEEGSARSGRNATHIATPAPADMPIRPTRSGSSPYSAAWARSHCTARAPSRIGVG